jgi:LuxR family transcriptional regulator, maltose regulon positive regulatory protein
VPVAKSPTVDVEGRSDEGADVDRHVFARLVSSAKLRPPARPVRTVRRSALLDRLLAADVPQVVSITAPPGYGKTTLLAQWADADPRPVAWLTLDRLDNDPAALVAGLAASLETVAGPLIDVATASVFHAEDAVAVALPRIARGLEEWGGRALLILDDVHVLAGRDAADLLALLVGHLPPTIGVALAGRAAPAAPLARLRAADRLLELGTEDLAMSDQEARQLAAGAGADLRADELQELQRSTEGWATGIYLAVRSRAGRGRGSPVRASGGDRDIAAYLRAEITDTLDPDDVTFLLRTSVLDDVDSRAAVAVAGSADAAMRLARLSEGRQLISQVGEAGGTYRYHHLLRDFLQGELERRDPLEARRLHGRAAQWYRSVGRADRAVDHAIASGDLDTAAELASAAGADILFTGRTTTFDGWIETLGPAVIQRHPELAVTAGWLYVLDGRPEPAERMALIADRSSLDGPLPDGSASFVSQRAMLRAIMARRGLNDALRSAAVAAAAEGRGSPWHTLANLLLGWTLELSGDLADASAAYEVACEEARLRPGGGAVSFAKRATLAIRGQRWDEAAQLLDRSRELMGTVHLDRKLAALLVYAASARVAIHAGEVQAARAHLVRAQLARPTATIAAPFFAVDGLLELARAYLAFSDPTGARGVLRDAEHILRQRPDLGTLSLELDDITAQLVGAEQVLAGSSALTVAEMRVLPFLPTYLSLPEIGVRLGISRNTVKTHAMSIYSKLWASSRGEAVERAVELGLLEPYPALQQGQRRL